MPEIGCVAPCRTWVLANDPGMRRACEDFLDEHGCDGGAAGLELLNLYDMWLSGATFDGRSFYTHSDPATGRVSIYPPDLVIPGVYYPMTPAELQALQALDPPTASGEQAFTYVDCPYAQIGINAQCKYQGAGTPGVTPTMLLAGAGVLALGLLLLAAGSGPATEQE